MINLHKSYVARLELGSAVRHTAMTQMSYEVCAFWMTVVYFTDLYLRVKYVSAIIYWRLYYFTSTSFNYWLAVRRNIVLKTLTKVFTQACQLWIPVCAKAVHKKKFCLLYPPLTQNLFWHFLKIIFFCLFFIRKSQFPHYAAMKKKKKKNMPKIFFFPTYLPNQKIQSRGTANKQFFKDGLMVPISWFLF